MKTLLVVGSGAAGAHFTMTALERGCRVTMVDAGYQRPAPVEPSASFDQLKERLSDPVGYFLGDADEGVVYPATKPSYYGHPPSKSYVFRTPPGFRSRGEGIAPLHSFARGGLAEAWTAGSYEFGPADLEDFPIPPSAMVEGYREVARRIGISGEPDDLARFIPQDAEYLPPLPLDPHSVYLLDRYRRRRSSLNRNLGFYLGRSRVATLSVPHRGRPACDRLGRCLWGCPTDAIYSPAVTLQECLATGKLTYRPGVLASHFEYDGDGRVTALIGRDLATGQPVSFSADVVVLAAGALASSKLFLDSIYRATGRIEELEGLMDNRQIHVPFLTPAMIGAEVDRASYQFHLLAFGLDTADPKNYIHGQITTLKAASVHPVLENLPVDYRAALAVFRSVRAGLALANINLPDRRRPQSRLIIRPVTGTGGAPSETTELSMSYQDDPAEPAAITEAIGRTKRAIRRLGGVVPPGMIRVLPKGASVHYAGTLPMSPARRPFGSTPEGRSWDFSNLILADGATFPFLPAKNLTFTLMANAVRIARALDFS
jgi:choline dehydrogenase-like flavoprotein